MITNKHAALIFRLCAAAFAVIGLMAQIGIFTGSVAFGAFMFYTIQSNILAFALFAVLAVRTAKDMKNSKTGNACYLPRLTMVLSVNLLITMLVFWTLLVPTVPTAYLWTFENIAVHTITPLLPLVDYILFARRGQLKYRDVYYVCIFPIGYVVFTTVAGLAGYVYRHEGVVGGGFEGYMELEPVRFPYFFLDFDRLGAMVLVYIAGMLVFFLAISHGLYFIDKKRKAKGIEKSERNHTQT